MNELNNFFQECLLHALIAAKKAGEAILSVYQGQIDVTYKDDKTPLTLADERAHSIVLNHLSIESLKEIHLLSEEGKHTPYDERKEWEYFWLVDPLDGTKEFIHRRGEFTVNIALINKNRPVLGVVLVPASGSLYFAAEGLGSYKIENAEVVSQSINDYENSSGENSPIDRIVNLAERLPLDHAPDTSERKITVVGSRSHASNALTSFVQAAEQEYENVEFIPAGSALKFGLVAEGAAHVYPRLGPTMEWDTAAGQCVVEQSGGAVIDLTYGTPLCYNKQELLNPHFICTEKHSRYLGDLLKI
ncbi:MAG: 3'(2'),5'-bisphosphate nucleotidase CysQ [Deltaproteobacteria bacterium]|nr:3'(2'),5'-bisphosphate nucleotidase CysQ [Deltaproteobacteria bacterium]